MGAFFGRHKILTGFLIVVCLFVLVVAGFVYHRTRGPFRSYRVDFVKSAGAAEPGTLEVGVAKRDITPNLAEYEPWTDADNNGRYDAAKDTYVDQNGNGKFDAVWMAGFSSNRPAKGVHDPLWARAIAFRNNSVTLAMVTLDSIGVFHDKLIAVRQSIDPSLKVDHVIFSSTHNHEAPDTMGNWSNNNIGSVGEVLSILMHPNFDHAYMAKVQQACKEAVEEAVRNLAPADMILAKAELDPSRFVDDSREPIVYDKTLCCARFVKAGTDETIAVMTSWGNHAETLGSSNTDLTSDFCGYWRDGVEKGVPEPNGVPGLGGTCLFFQGMVGGLMTQLHLEVPHRDGVQRFREASWEKAQALGENLAVETVKALQGLNAVRVEKPEVAVAAKTIFAPMEGLFKYAIMLGLIHPGYYGGQARTEVNAVRIGDLEILTIPGELYPEIAEGGVTTPAGGDFGLTEPVENPPLRGMMRGKVNMVIGLANDEIGYIIPKSQWDVKPPYAYGDRAQYGEENSGGPEVAPIIHRESLEVLRQLHEAL